MLAPSFFLPDKGRDITNETEDTPDAPAVVTEQEVCCSFDAPVRNPYCF